DARDHNRACPVLSLSPLGGEGRGEGAKFRERHQRLQALADDIRVRQLGFVRQNLPGRIIKGPFSLSPVDRTVGTIFSLSPTGGEGRGEGATCNLEPRLDILMKRLLGFDAVSDNHQRPSRLQALEQRSQKRLAAATHASARQCAAVLQALKQVVYSRSRRGGLEEPRRTCVMFDQLAPNLPQYRSASRQV